MKTRMFRFRLDCDREERWLNDLSARGLALCDAFMVRYTFEDAEPGKYIYRIAFLKNLFWTAEMRNYIKFIEDSGAECVGAYGRWAYFRKPASEGAFELNSDRSSKLQHYRSMSAMYGLLGLGQLYFIVSRVLDVLNDAHRLSDGLAMTVAALHGLLCSVLLVMAFRSWRRLRRLKREGKVFE